jgi:DNA-binding response OmpR family regulator
MADSLPDPEEEYEFREALEAFKATKPEELRQLYEGLRDLAPRLPLILPVPGLVRMFANADHLQQDDTPSIFSRLRLDPQAHTIALDGREYSVENPRAFELYKFLVKSAGLPRTRADIRNAYQNRLFKGDKTIPRLLETLPAAIRKTIKSGHKGYWISLLPKK